MDRKITQVTSLDVLMPLIREQLHAGQSVRFSPKGTSMLPMLRENVDSVVLSPVPERLKCYDLPLYQRDDGKYVLHRVVRAGECYTMLGDNQFVCEPGIRHDQLIGVVTAFYRGRRMYKTEDWSYGVYCRVWFHSRHVRHVWRRGIRWIRRQVRKRGRR